MAAGCACVASDCPTGPADLIEDHKNGRLLPVDASSDVWIEVLESLLRDEKQRARFGDQALCVRERYSERYNRKTYLDAIEGLRTG